MTFIPNKNCDMCFMPFSKDPGERDNPDYCSFCHRNGEFTYKGNDVEEFKQICYRRMRERGVNRLKAKFYTWSIRFAPYWKKEDVSPHK